MWNTFRGEAHSAVQHLNQFLLLPVRLDEIKPFFYNAFCASRNPTFFDLLILNIPLTSLFCELKWLLVWIQQICWKLWEPGNSVYNQSTEAVTHLSQNEKIILQYFSEGLDLICLQLWGRIEGTGCRISTFSVTCQPSTSGSKTTKTNGHLLVATKSLWMKALTHEKGTH